MSSRKARILIRGKCPNCGDEIIIILDKAQTKHLHKSFKMPSKQAKSYLRRKMSPVILAPGRKKQDEIKPAS